MSGGLELTSCRSWAQANKMESFDSHLHGMRTLVRQTPLDFFKAFGKSSYHSQA
jgi:hypothetical protein